MENNDKDFAQLGKNYQEKVVHALFHDKKFADQMSDVLEPSYFTYKYLELLTDKLFSHARKYKEFPSADVVEMQIAQDEAISKNDALLIQVNDFISRMKTTPIDGDIKWIQENSLEFCQRQALVGAITDILDKVEEKEYSSIQKIMKEALNKGAPRDAGHDYDDGVVARAKKSVRSPMSTGWPVVDKILNGGWEKGTISTIIAPTGAGKSMFLVNVAAAGIEQGLKVLYITLEMADWKIALRADSYFSGIPINDIPDNTEKVKEAISSKVKGKLIVKEWPTKTASVQTIRAHLQKLEQTKEFKPDIIVLDYADLLRGSKGYGEKRYELEGNYEELRCLAQEFNCAVVTADQTNRAGLNEELVTLSAIAESYAKATVCDLIMTVSRTVADKENGTGRLFIAKSRLGEDGVVLPFLLRPATVKVTVLDRNTNPAEIMLSDPDNFKKMMADRFNAMTSGTKNNKA